METSKLRLFAATVAIIIAAGLFLLTLSLITVCSKKFDNNMSQKSTETHRSR
jgi:hypothetical protein